MCRQVTGILGGIGLPGTPGITVNLLKHVHPARFERLLEASGTGSQTERLVESAGEAVVIA